MAEEKVAAQPAETHTIQDRNGRSIVLKAPGVLAQFDLLEYLGPSLSENTTYFRMVMPMLYVVAINGEPNPLPQTKLQLRGLMTILGDAGVAAVHEHVLKIWGTKVDQAEAAADGVVALAKK